MWLERKKIILNKCLEYCIYNIYYWVKKKKFNFLWDYCFLLSIYFKIFWIKVDKMLMCGFCVVEVVNDVVIVVNVGNSFI